MFNMADPKTEYLEVLISAAEKKLFAAIIFNKQHVLQTQPRPNTTTGILSDNVATTSDPQHSRAAINVNSLFAHATV